MSKLGQRGGGGRLAARVCLGLLVHAAGRRLRLALRLGWGVLGFMLWAWVSAVAVLIGAVLNAELERQAIPEAASAQPRP